MRPQVTSSIKVINMKPGMANQSYNIFRYYLMSNMSLLIKDTWPMAISTLTFSIRVSVNIYLADIIWL